jgi:hypothetical protein
MLHFCGTAIIVHAVVQRVCIQCTPFTACLRKPATGSFVAAMTLISNKGHFLFSKKKQK